MSSLIEEILRLNAPDALDRAIIRNSARRRSSTVTEVNILGIGIFFMALPFSSEPPPDPALILGLSNAHTTGTLVRQTFGMLYRDGQGSPDYDFLDECLDLLDTHNKKYALQIEPGINSPEWFFDLPDAKHIIAGAHSEMSTVPFDPVFQEEWEIIQQGLADRYKGRTNLKYVKIQGPGIASESFFAITEEEQEQADQLASDLGYPDKITAWKDGVETLIDMYASVWSPVKIQMVTGPPYGRLTGSVEALLEMFDYGDANHRGLFGAAGHDLNSINPQRTDPSAIVVSGISPHSSGTGFQMHNSLNDEDPNPPYRLSSALNIGMGFGAHVIEVFKNDLEGTGLTPEQLVINNQILDAANVRMLSV